MISSSRMVVFTMDESEYATIVEFIRKINSELDANITFREFEITAEANKPKKIKCECWIN